MKDYYFYLLFNITLASGLLVLYINRFVSENSDLIRPAFFLFLGSAIALTTEYLTKVLQNI